MKVFISALWIFCGVFILWLVLLVVGINRAIGGLAHQWAPSRLDDVVEAIIFVPQRLFGSGIVGNLASLAWVFGLCVALAALYHAVRSRLSRNASKHS